MPAAVSVAVVILLVLAVASCQALLQRHALRATALAFLQAPFWCTTWRDILLRGHNRPLGLERREGEWWLLRGQGQVQVHISGRSLYWGRCALIVFEDRQGWLWLGPGNTPEVELAALRRELVRQGKGRRVVA